LELYLLAIVFLILVVPVTFNQTYLDEWLKINGCNCTKEYMEKAARMID
jgi:hypothetical protein